MKKQILTLITFGIVLLFAMPASAVNFKRVWDKNCNGEFVSTEYPGDPIYIRCTCAPEGCGTGCPERPALWVGDPTDNVAADQLIDASDLAILGGQNTGSQSINYQVLGENFTRVYQVIWYVNSSDQYEQSFTRTDVPFSVE